MRRFRAQAATGNSLALPSLVLLTLLATMALASCNTMAGAGEDLQAAGSAVEREAEDANE